jgi:hypothetical protein
MFGGGQCPPYTPFHTLRVGRRRPKNLETEMLRGAQHDKKAKKCRVGSAHQFLRVPK